MSIKPTQKKPPTGPLFVGQSTDELEYTDDFVDDVLRVVGALVPDMTPEQCRAAAAAVRDRWGGDRPYIARRAGEGRSSRNEQIVAEYRRGERAEFLARRWGLSYVQIWRIINRIPSR
jgi:Mor family transcriptional regulator